MNEKLLGYWGFSCKSYFQRDCGVFPCVVSLPFFLHTSLWGRNTLNRACSTCGLQPKLEQVIHRTPGILREYSLPSKGDIVSSQGMSPNANRNDVFQPRWVLNHTQCHYSPMNFLGTSSPRFRTKAFINSSKL